MSSDGLQIALLSAYLGAACSPKANCQNKIVENEKVRCPSHQSKKQSSCLIQRKKKRYAVGVARHLGLGFDQSSTCVS